ncbi:hypothetical protein F4703DRAFT_1931481 [Phycomyces blakesleeanus]
MQYEKELTRQKIKANKVCSTEIIIAFGTGMKGKHATKFKGYCVGGVGVLYRALKSKEMSGDFLVADVDKFRVPKPSLAKVVG